MNSDFTLEEWENMYNMMTSKDESNHVLVEQIFLTSENETDLLAFEILKEFDKTTMDKITNIEDRKVFGFLLEKYTLTKLQWFYSFSEFKILDIKIKIDG